MNLLEERIAERRAFVEECRRLARKHGRKAEFFQAIASIMDRGTWGESFTVPKVIAEAVQREADKEPEMVPPPEPTREQEVERAKESLVCRICGNHGNGQFVSCLKGVDEFAHEKCLEKEKQA